MCNLDDNAALNVVTSSTQDLATAVKLMETLNANMEAMGTRGQALEAHMDNWLKFVNAVQTHSASASSTTPGKPT
jgi:hypothetical protein